MSKTYLALTIGPIVDTLLSARKTRELWGASYLFSYMVKQIIAVAIGQNRVNNAEDNSDFQWNNNFQPLSGENLLLPTTADEGYTFGAGLYPDRIYFLSTNIENDRNQINQSIDKVIWDLAADMARHVNRGETTPKYTAEEIGDYLRNYFRINVLEVNLDNDANIINSITPYLDASEQHPRLTPPEDIEKPAPLMHFLDKVNGSFLFRDGFWNMAERRAWIAGLTGDDKETFEPLISEVPRTGFKSLIEIATTQLRRCEANIDDRYMNIINTELGNNENPDDTKELEIEESIIEKFRKPDNFQKDWRAYHKYIAVVHVDGDNVGKIIGKVATNPSQLKEFSTRLREFALEAVKEIVKYGGSPIYAGGDDLLFFAPVACIHKASRNFQTVFNLIKNLDERFNTKLTAYAATVGANINPETNQPDLKLLPTLTYGLSVSYYKYPLYEARNNSYKLMDDIKSECKGEKNAIGIKFLKHSGQKIEFNIHKHRNQIWQSFSHFIENNTSTTSPASDANFLNSLTHRLEDLWVQLKAAKGRREYLLPFFKNNFNENWGRNETFYMSIIDLLEKCWAQSTQAEQEEEYGKEKPCWLDPVYGALRFVHFINSKDKGDE